MPTLQSTPDCKFPDYATIQVSTIWVLPHHVSQASKILYGCRNNLKNFSFDFCSCCCSASVMQWVPRLTNTNTPLNNMWPPYAPWVLVLPIHIQKTAATYSMVTRTLFDISQPFLWHTCQTECWLKSAIESPKRENKLTHIDVSEVDECGWNFMRHPYLMSLSGERNSNCGGQQQHYWWNSWVSIASNQQLKGKDKTC
jgi:hypothetical protein